MLAYHIEWHMRKALAPILSRNTMSMARQLRRAILSLLGDLATLTLNTLTTTIG
jgi:hypothetical protein